MKFYPYSKKNKGGGGAGNVLALQKGGGQNILR